MTSPPSRRTSRSRAEGTRSTRPGAAGHGSRATGDHATVLDDRDDAGAADRRVAAAGAAGRRGGGRVAGAQQRRRDPAQRRLRRRCGPRGPAARGGEPAADADGDVPAVEGGDVGGVDGVQRGCPAAKTPGAARAQRGVDARARSVPGSRSRPAEPGELVVGDPVAGEDDGVARDAAAGAGAQVLELDGLDPLPAPIRDDPGARRRPGSAARAGAASRNGGVRLAGRRARVVEQRRPAARLAQREHGRPADELGAHDDRARARRRPVLQVHEVLQLARGEHAGGPVARDQPGRARALAGAGGQDDGVAPRRVDPAVRAR